MKNLLFTLVLLFSLHSFGQFINAPVEKAVLLRNGNHQGYDNHIVVPDGKMWQLVASSSRNEGFPNSYGWKYIDLDGTEAFQNIVGPAVLSEGWKIYYEISNLEANVHLNFIEYNLDNQGLSYNNPNLDNKIRLFPNPTTSEVALNSDKQYDIEVYDILGNKVMELTGNTIDMEHLSSATYIVNALDTETNERLSYKVIKN
jgi:hypothetical protein